MFHKILKLIITSDHLNHRSQTSIKETKGQGYYPDFYSQKYGLPR